MSMPARLAVIAITALLVIGLLGWARGDKHHRGDEVGSFASIVAG